MGPLCRVGEAGRLLTLATVKDGGSSGTETRRKSDPKFFAEKSTVQVQTWSFMFTTSCILQWCRKHTENHATCSHGYT